MHPHMADLCLADALVIFTFFVKIAIASYMLSCLSVSLSESLNSQLFSFRDVHFQCLHSHGVT